MRKLLLLILVVIINLSLNGQAIELDNDELSEAVPFNNGILALQYGHHLFFEGEYFSDHWDAYADQIIGTDIPYSEFFIDDSLIIWIMVDGETESDTSLIQILDNSGTPLYHYGFNHSGHNFDFIRYGDYYIFGYKNKMIKFDKQLNVLNEIEFSSHDIISSIDTSNNKILLLSTTLPPNWAPIIIELNENLDSLDSFIYMGNDPGIYISEDMDINEEGNIIVGQREFNSEEDPTDFSFIMFDSDYTFQWKTTYEVQHESPTDMRWLKENMILGTVGNSGMFLLDESGEEIDAAIEELYGNLHDSDSSFYLTTGASVFRVSGSGEIIPWTIKARITHNSPGNPMNLICMSSGSNEIYLTIELPYYFNPHWSDFPSYNWSNGSHQPYIVVNDLGTYYADINYSEGNKIYTDTVSLGDNYTLIENPVLDIHTNNNLNICSGDEETITVEILNDNGHTYQYRELYTHTDFIESIALSADLPYTIRITDTFECYTDTSFYLTIKHPFTDNICLVTLDPETRKNKIVINKTPDQGIEQYYVTRGHSDHLVGNLLFTDDKNYLIDEESIPGQQAYRYYLTATDTCGNSITSGNDHKTIHLTSNVGAAGEVNLIWEHYDGRAYSNYNIYQSTDSINFNLINTLEFDEDIHQFTVFNAPEGKSYYRLGITGFSPCLVENAVDDTISEILSNVKSFYNKPGTTTFVHQTSKDRPVEIFPNPATEYIHLKIPAEFSGSCDLFIYDMLGQVITSMTKMQIPNNSIVLTKNHFGQKGIYFIKIIVDQQQYSGKVIIN